MKATKKLLAISLVIVALCTSIYAHNDASANIIHYPDENITVIFDDATGIDSDKKQFIANALVYGSPVQSRAWCWLTGHSYIENGVEVITHKISPESPRCWSDFYLITTCEKCDYYEEEYLNGSSVFCCPEE